MKIKKIDPFSIDVYNFRKEIIEIDENYDICFLDKEIKYNKNIPEEVWKFSFKKWNSLNLDSLYGVFINNELAAINGVKLYGKNKNYLRAGMMYYILKRFRKNLRSPLWIKNGLLDTAIKDFRNIDYSFISIYPHNKQLASWVKAFSRKKNLGQLGTNIDSLYNLKTFTKYPNPIYFNNVQQHIFYRQESINSISIEDLVLEIQDK